MPPCLVDFHKILSDTVRQCFDVFAGCYSIQSIFSNLYNILCRHWQETNIHVLILHYATAFYKNIVNSPAFTIHAEFYLNFFHYKVCEPIRGKLASLICIDDLRFAMFFHSFLKHITTLLGCHRLT